MSLDGHVLVREVNDRIYHVLQENGSEDGDFLCECDSEECREMIQITLREYAALRARGGDLVSRGCRRPSVA
jgi:hypothetical protein